jgi:hypothetical protein
MTVMMPVRRRPIRAYRRQHPGRHSVISITVGYQLHGER